MPVSACILTYKNFFFKFKTILQIEIAAKDEICECEIGMVKHFLQSQIKFFCEILAYSKYL